MSYTYFLEEVFESSEPFERCLFKWVEFHRLAMSQSDGMMDLIHSEGCTLSKTMKDQLQSHKEKINILMQQKIKESITQKTLPTGTNPDLVLALLFGTITHYYFPEARKSNVAHLETEDFVKHMMKLISVPLI